MNIPNLNLLKNKKAFVLICCIILGIIIGYISDKLTNHKLTNSIFLSYLYLKNSGQIAYDGILLKVPFYYTRVQKKDSLTLLKFPKGGDVILFNKKCLPKDKFDEEFKSLLRSTNFLVVNEGEIIIDDENCYFITASNKSNPSEYRGHLTIPNKSITISFIGDKKDSESFWEIIKQIKFVS